MDNIPRKTAKFRHSSGQAQSLSFPQERFKETQNGVLQPEGEKRVKRGRTSPWVRAKSCGRQFLNQKEGSRLAKTNYPALSGGIPSLKLHEQSCRTSIRR